MVVRNFNVNENDISKSQQKTNTIFEKSSIEKSKKPVKVTRDGKTFIQMREEGKKKEEPQEKFKTYTNVEDYLNEMYSATGEVNPNDEIILDYASKIEVGDKETFRIFDQKGRMLEVNYGGAGLGDKENKQIRDFLTQPTKQDKNLNVGDFVKVEGSEIGKITSMDKWQNNYRVRMQDGTTVIVFPGAIEKLRGSEKLEAEKQEQFDLMKPSSVSVFETTMRNGDVGVGVKLQGEIVKITKEEASRLIKQLQKVASIDPSLEEKELIRPYEEKIISLQNGVINLKINLDNEIFRYKNELDVISSRYHEGISDSERKNLEYDSRKIESKLDGLIRAKELFNDGLKHLI